MLRTFLLRILGETNGRWHYHEDRQHHHSGQIDGSEHDRPPFKMETKKNWNPVPIHC